MAFESSKSCRCPPQDHKFFKVVKGDLFTQILSRETLPPLLPEGEEYSKEEFLSDLVTLSDAEELADVELPLDLAEIAISRPWIAYIIMI